MTLKYDDSMDPGNPSEQDWVLVAVAIGSILVIIYAALSHKGTDCEKQLCDEGQHAVLSYGECICSEGAVYAQ